MPFLFKLKHDVARSSLFLLLLFCALCHDIHLLFDLIWFILFFSIFEHLFKVESEWAADEFFDCESNYHKLNFISRQIEHRKKCPNSHHLIDSVRDFVRNFFNNLLRLIIQRRRDEIKTPYTHSMYSNESNLEFRSKLWMFRFFLFLCCHHINFCMVYKFLYQVFENRCNFDDDNKNKRKKHCSDSCIHNFLSLSWIKFV